MEISEIKAQLSILGLLKSYSLTPDRNKRINCPFHDDKTPSMHVYTETNTVYCFSSNCKLHGKPIDQIDFIMHKESCTKHKAILKAKELLNHKPQNMNQEPSLQDRFVQMRSSLLKSKKALSYLSGRNLTKDLEIGFNSYQSGYKQLQNCIVFPLKNRSGNIKSLY